MKTARISALLLVALMTLAGIGIPMLHGETEPPKGGTLVIGLVSEPTVLDSCSGSWNVAPFAGNIFNSLLETDENMNIVPGLAESWTIDYENKMYLFKIRSGITWHDGQPLTLEDIKFSFEYLLPTYDNRGLFLKNTTVEIINETTVALKPGIFAPGIQIPRFASADWVVYPKHLLEGVDFLTSNFRKAPIGTGPFKFKEWVKGSHIVMERNENYWRPGKPYLDQIIVKFIPDSATLLAAIIAGDIDYVYRGLPYEAYKALVTDPKLQVFIDYKPNYKVFIVFNLNHSDPFKKEVLSNPLVRKAIAHAINKTDIVYKATLNVCRVSDRFWAPEFMPENPSITVYDYNPEKANKLLDEAGYPMTGGKRFSLELLVRSGEADEVKSAEVLRDYLKAVGIDITIKAVDFTTAEQLQANYQYDIAIIKRWINPVFSYYNHHSSAIQKGKILMNIAQYSNPQVDHYYDEWAYYATSDEERTQALLNVETILTYDLPELPFYDVAWMYIWNKKVGNAFAPARNWLQSESLENVYIKEEVSSPTPTPETSWWIYGVIAIIAIVLVAVVASFWVKKARRKG